MPLVTGLKFNKKKKNKYYCDNSGFQSLNYTLMCRKNVLYFKSNHVYIVILIYKKKTYLIITLVLDWYFDESYNG